MGLRWLQNLQTIPCIALSTAVHCLLYRQEWELVLLEQLWRLASQQHDLGSGSFAVLGGWRRSHQRGPSLEVLGGLPNHVSEQSTLIIIPSALLGPSCLLFFFHRCPSLSLGAPTSLGRSLASVRLNKQSLDRVIDVPPWFGEIPQDQTWTKPEPLLGVNHEKLGDLVFARVKNLNHSW